MNEFVFEALPARVIFGSGTLTQVAVEIECLGLRSVLVLATKRQLAEVGPLLSALGGRLAGTFSDAAMHTPVVVTEQALHMVHALDVDGLVAIGGGSSIGLAKALALRTDLPQVVVPTTYAGSEMTPILGETKDGAKTTQRNAKVLPEVVVYDVDLTLSMPAELSGPSGLNAIAHAVEALYAREANPIVSMMAEEGVARLARALGIIAGAPRDRTAREDALYGAFLCGLCLGSVGMALHHKLCHTLGGAFDLPHAATHGVILPHAFAYNAPAAPDAVHRLSRALETADPALALYRLAARIGSPRALRDLGMPRDGIDRATDLVLANPYWNPRPLEREPIRRLIEAAWEGAPPDGSTIGGG